MLQIKIIKIGIQNPISFILQPDFHKFNQNEELRAFIIGTGDRILVEASPVDAMWGTGMAADHPEIYNPEKWRGPNLLGFALMEARDMIKEN